MAFYSASHLNLQFHKIKYHTTLNERLSIYSHNLQVSRVNLLLRGVSGLAIELELKMNLKQLSYCSQFE